MRCSAVYPWTLNVATRGVLTHLENTKKSFSAGAPPRTPLGALTTLPRPPSWLGRGILPPHAPAPRRLRRLDSRRMAPRISTPPASRLGASILCAPLPLWSAPSNGFSWRRACRRGLAMSILSVCPSVCLSVKRVLCDKTVERSVQIYIPHERTCRAQ